MINGDMQEAELRAQIMRGMRMSLMDMHKEHDKDTVCLYCFNRRLAKMPWTYVPGERIPLSRFVAQSKTGRFYMRRARPNFTNNYEAGRG